MWIRPPLAEPSHPLADLLAPPFDHSRRRIDRRQAKQPTQSADLDMDMFVDTILVPLDGGLEDRQPALSRFGDRPTRYCALSIPRIAPWRQKSLIVSMTGIVTQIGDW